MSLENNFSALICLFAWASLVGAFRGFSHGIGQTDFPQRSNNNSENDESGDVNLKAVDVVVGVILNERKFLAEKRKPNEPIDPGITCLPGGHVEPGETYEHALKREMKEELNIEVKKMKFIKRASWTASNGEKQNVHYYLVLDYQGNPECRTAENVSWITNTRELDIEIDRQAVRESRAMLRRESLKSASTPNARDTGHRR